MLCLHGCLCTLSMTGPEGGIRSAELGLQVTVSIHVGAGIEPRSSSRSSGRAASTLNSTPNFIYFFKSQSPSVSVCFCLCLSVCLCLRLSLSVPLSPPHREGKRERKITCICMMCVFIFACESTSVHATAHVWRSKDNLGCQSWPLYTQQLDREGSVFSLWRSSFGRKHPTFFVLWGFKLSSSYLHRE